MLGDKSNPPPSSAAVKAVDHLYELHVVVAGLVDVEAEIENLQAGENEKKVVISRYDKKMLADGYKTRVR